MLHELKTHPEQFEEVLYERKKREFRRNDRNFKVFDLLILREYGPLTGYSGQYLLRVVTHILHEGFGIPEGFCILSIRPLSTEEESNHSAGITVPNSQDKPALS